MLPVQKKKKKPQWSWCVTRRLMTTVSQRRKEERRAWICTPWGRGRALTHNFRHEEMRGGGGWEGWGGERNVLGFKRQGRGGVCVSPLVPFIVVLPCASFTACHVRFQQDSGRGGVGRESKVVC
eukprot:Sspe_Gene.60287::Locus_33206_Transcript_1_1_Confidence_1.000_Length_433::g.60287::m.60287